MPLQPRAHGFTIACAVPAGDEDVIAVRLTARPLLCHFGEELGVLQAGASGRTRSGKRLILFDKRHPPCKHILLVRFHMLRWAVIFLVIAIVAAVLGLSGVAWMAKEIAWILVVVFLILFVVSLILGRRGPPAA